MKPPAPVLTNISLLPNGNVKIKWTENASNEGGFVIERKIGNGSFNVIDFVKIPNSTYYIDDDPLDAQYAYYRVRTITADTSHPSNILGIQTPPNPPTNLHAVVNPDYSVTLTWQDNSQFNDGYEIWRESEVEGKKLIASIGDVSS